MAWVAKVWPGPEADTITVHNGDEDVHGRVVARVYRKNDPQFAVLVRDLIQVRIDTGEWPQVRPSPITSEEDHHE